MMAVRKRRKTRSPKPWKTSLISMRLAAANAARKGCITEIPIFILFFFEGGWGENTMKSAYTKVPITDDEDY